MSRGGLHPTARIAPLWLIILSIAYWGATAFPAAAAGGPGLSLRAPRELQAMPGDFVALPVALTFPRAERPEPESGPACVHLQVEAPDQWAIAWTAHPGNEPQLEAEGKAFRLPVSSSGDPAADGAQVFALLSPPAATPAGLAPVVLRARLVSPCPTGSPAFDRPAFPLLREGDGAAQGEEIFTEAEIQVHVHVHPRAQVSWRAVPAGPAPAGAEVTLEVEARNTGNTALQVEAAPLSFLPWPREKGSARAVLHPGESAILPVRIAVPLSAFPGSLSVPVRVRAALASSPESPSVRAGEVSRQVLHFPLAVLPPRREHAPGLSGQVLNGRLALEQRLNAPTRSGAATSPARGAGRYRLDLHLPRESGGQVHSQFFTRLSWYFEPGQHHKISSMGPVPLQPPLSPALHELNVEKLRYEGRTWGLRLARDDVAGPRLLPDSLSPGVGRLAWAEWNHAPSGLSMGFPLSASAPSTVVWEAPGSLTRLAWAGSPGNPSRAPWALDVDLPLLPWPKGRPAGVALLELSWAGGSESRIQEGKLRWEPVNALDDGGLPVRGFWQGGLHWSRLRHRHPSGDPEGLLSAGTGTAVSGESAGAWVRRRYDSGFLGISASGGQLDRASTPGGLRGRYMELEVEAGTRLVRPAPERPLPTVDAHAHVRRRTFLPGPGNDNSRTEDDVRWRLRASFASSRLAWFARWRLHPESRQVDHQVSYRHRPSRASWWQLSIGKGQQRPGEDRWWAGLDVGGELRRWRWRGTLTWNLAPSSGNEPFRWHWSLQAPHREGWNWRVGLEGPEPLRFAVDARRSFSLALPTRPRSARVTGHLELLDGRTDGLAAGNQLGEGRGLDGGPGSLAGVVLTLGPYRAVTAEDGSFAFPAVAPGHYRLTVAEWPAALAGRFLLGDEPSVAVQPGTDVSVSLPLILPAQVTGTVSEPGIQRVSLLDKDGNVVATVPVSGGRFRFAGLAPGLYAVEAAGQRLETLALAAGEHAALHLDPAAPRRPRITFQASTPLLIPAPVNPDQPTAP